MIPGRGEVFIHLAPESIIHISPESLFTSLRNDYSHAPEYALYQATKGILRKVNKLALTALRLAASRKATRVEEAILLDATAEALL